MPQRITCPSPECGGVLEVPDDQAGQRVLCPECGAAVDVPAPTDGEDHFDRIRAAAGEGKVLHPARQQCPNCGAMLGVRAAICPQCGADIRTGAVARVAGRKKVRDWTPFIIGGGIAAGLIVLIVLIVAATSLMKKREETAQLAAEQAEREAVVSEPVDAGPQEDVPRVELTEADFGTLGEQELAISQAVSTYKVRLRDVLEQVQGADSETVAAQWADLAGFCRDNGLLTEADMCWMRAAQLRPQAADVNAKLGRTETYAGLPVTAEQKQFLDGLRPTVRVINRAVGLSGHRVRVGGEADAPLGWADRPEFRPAPGDVLIEVTPRAESSGLQQALALTVHAGLTYAVTFCDATTAPQVNFDSLANMFNAFTNSGEAGNVAIERDWQGQVLSMRAGALRASGTQFAPVSMELRSQGVLSVTGLLADGDLYTGGGQHVFWGGPNSPLSFNIDSEARTVKLTSGTYCRMKADLADGLWGVLATAQGDMESAWARRQLARRAAQLYLKTTDLEAQGQLAAPWRGLDADCSEMAALHERLQKEARLADRAYQRPAGLDCARALGAEDRSAHLYLNWPRYRDALSALTGECATAIIYMAGPQEEPERGEATAAGPRLSRRQTYRALARPERGAPIPAFGRTRRARSAGEASPLAPPGLTLDEQTRQYALMRVLAVLPDDLALQHARDYWSALDYEAKVAALVSLEKVRSPEAIAFLGKLSQESGEMGVVTAALMSLGSIGTPEALRYCETPGVLPTVRMASLAARAAAGDPDVLDGLSASLSGTNAEGRATFLGYATQTDTPATVLVLSTAIDRYPAADARAKIAQALVRIGGHTAISELARLMQDGGEIYPDLLDSVEPDDATVLIRVVGTAVAGGKADEQTVDFLLKKGGEVGRQFLRAAAVNQGSAPAIMVLLREGTTESVEAAAQAAHTVDMDLLKAIRRRWYTVGRKAGEWAWHQPVDSRAAKDFLRAVFENGNGPKVKLCAAQMMTEVGEKPDMQLLLSLADVQEEKLEAPRREARSRPMPGRDGERPDDIEGRYGRRPTARDYSPPDFTEPTGMPRLPGDFKLEGKPQLYALGLLVRLADESACRRLREMMETCKDGEIRRAIMLALGRIGGEANLEFLRARATARADSYADSGEVVRELRRRLVALAALGDAQDADFLPQLLAMLTEAPPANEAIIDVGDYEDLSAWWQIRLWREACDTVADICRAKQLFDLTGDGDLQRRMTERLLALIEQPGPDNGALGQAREQLKGKAMRAYARSASPYEEATLLVLKRLGLAVPQAEVDDGRRRVGRPRGRGGQAAGASNAAFMEALQDAVAYVAVRSGNLDVLSEVPGTLPSQGKTSEAWSRLLRAMASSPPPRYFDLVNMVSYSLTDEARQGIFDATRGKGDRFDSGYALFVAGMIRRPVRDKTAEDETAVETTLQRPADEIDFADLTPEEIEAMEAEQGGYGIRFDRPRARAAEQITYLRYGTRRKQGWAYSIEEVADTIGALRRKWAVVELLFESDPTAVAVAVQREQLFNHRDFGSEIAVRYAEVSNAARERILTAMRDVLIGGPRAVVREDAGPGFGRATALASASARRSAALTLRRLGGEDAAQTLYDALVGPLIEEAALTEEELIELRDGPRQRPRDMLTRGPRAGATTPPDEGALSVARALGGMGRIDLLSQALNAQDRPFFSDQPVTVQMAALEGMAFLPDHNQAVALLSELLGLANTAELREAVGSAIAKVLARAGLG